MAIGSEVTSEGALGTAGEAKEQVKTKGRSGGFTTKGLLGRSAALSASAQCPLVRCITKRLSKRPAAGDVVAACMRCYTALSTHLNVIVYAHLVEPPKQGIYAGIRCHVCVHVSTSTASTPRD